MAFIQMPRFRIITQSAPTPHRITHAHKPKQASTSNLAQPIEASQHQEVVVAASPTDHAATHALAHHRCSPDDRISNALSCVFGELPPRNISPRWVSCGAAQKVIAAKGPVSGAVIKDY